MLFLLGLLTISSAKAQGKIGLVDPLEALDQIAEYKTLKMRLDSYLSLQKNRVDSIKGRLAWMEKELKATAPPDEHTDMTYYNYKLEGMKNNINRERMRIQPILQEIEQSVLARENELSRSFYPKLNQSIEEIALEYKFDIVINPSLLDERTLSELQGNFSEDITELVVERMKEKQ